MNKNENWKEPLSVNLPNEALLRTGTRHWFRHGASLVLQCCRFHQKSQVPVAEVVRYAKS